MSNDIVMCDPVCICCIAFSQTFGRNNMLRSIYIMHRQNNMRDIGSQNAVFKFQISKKKVICRLSGSFHPGSTWICSI